MTLIVCIKSMGLLFLLLLLFNVILIAITGIAIGIMRSIKKLEKTISELKNEENREEEIKQYEQKQKKRKLWVNIQIVFIILILVFDICIGGLLYLQTYRPPAMDKPIIYLYPEEETEISVTVDKSENFTTTYPKYEEGWKVVAKPDGSLTDTKTGRSLYALYWEGKREKMPKLETGFIVKREDTASFLEEKLVILGLNEREAEEFIIYWLPQLEKHPYNWIYFETKEEINENMKLEVSPKPDTCIRVMMNWKGLDKAISVPEQTLEKQERIGYTVVEWGGTEIK